MPLYLAVISLALRQPLIAVGFASWWALAHWVAVSRREPSLKRRVLAFPIVLATDALTGGALLVGSARSFSLVL